MMNRIQERTLQLLETAPNQTVRTHWLLRLAQQDNAHPKIIQRIEKIYQARLFMAKLEPGTVLDDTKFKYDGSDWVLEVKSAKITKGENEWGSFD
jgi:hypothetical protein